MARKISRDGLCSACGRKKQCKACKAMKQANQAQAVASKN